MLAEGRLGISLLVPVVVCFGGSLMAGFQPRTAVFFTVGGVGLVVSFALFLRSFRPLLESFRGRRFLNVALLVIVLHGLFLFGETALRLADAFRQRSHNRAVARDQSRQATDNHPQRRAGSKGAASRSPGWLKSHEAFIVNEWLPSSRSSSLRRLHRKTPPLGRTLAPNASIRRLDSVIRINSHGTRGPEFSLLKASNELRVLCLGASTTWGATTKADDRPYPEALEEFLKIELDRPVTVINGGMVGVRIQFTALRFEHELMRFHPDVVVVYHGFNDVPSGVQGDFRFQPKASLLIGNVLLLHAKWSVLQTSQTQSRHAKFRKGLNKIVELCAQNDITLFVCSFALAYDEHTPVQHLKFYERIMPLYGGQTAISALQSVRLNNQFVRKVSQHPNVTFIDVESVLGGRYEYFIDFCHFTQSGRDLLAQEIGQTLVDRL
jgi:lysophospholipase L1-like esterase